MSPSISFRSISRDAQLLIYKKMENCELAAVASSCRDAYEFTEQNKKALSSRPHFGTSLTLWAKEDGTIVCANHLLEQAEGGHFQFPVDDDFYDKMSLISVRSLDIINESIASLPRIVEIFKKWNPVCFRIGFLRNIPLLTRMEMIEIARSQSTTMLACNPTLFMENKDILKQSPKAGMAYINMYGHEWNEDGVFENIRHFSGIQCNMTPEYITKFLLDLSNSKDIGKFRSFCFDLDFDPLDGIEEDASYVPYKLWTETSKLLFIQYKKAGYRKYPSWKIQKIPLKNNMCVLVNEKEEYHPGSKIVGANVIHDNEEEILDCLLEDIHICKEYFSNEQKNRYLEMNDTERLNELLKQYCLHEHIWHTEFHRNCIR